MEENTFENKKLLIVGIAGLIFSLLVGLVNFFAGVNSVLNLAIVICLFIVLACTIAYSAQEKKELAEIKETEIKNEIDEIMPNITKILSLLDNVDSKVKECNESIELSGRKLSDATNGQIKAVMQIRDKLGERANTVRSLIDTREDEKIQEAKQMLLMPLTFPIDSVNSLVLSTAPRMPDLPHDQWEPTVTSILDRVSKEVQELT